MLIVGVYPRQFTESAENTPLHDLYLKLSELLPASVIVHVLPMWKSEGDGGFAVSSWSQLDPQFGNIAELKAIASKWRTIIDGVFNHVGWGHEIAQEFLSDPDTHLHLLHAVRTNVEPDAPFAPRGGSVYLEKQISGSTWFVWHTFGDQAADINLSDNQVRAKVEDAIDFYADLGIWGLRLDALGYFGKSATSKGPEDNPGGVEVHNPVGIEIAEGIIEYASYAGLKCMLQIDCDEKIELYKKAFRHNPTVIDYSYTAQFVFSILFQDAQRMARHLKAVRETEDYMVMRPLRTHDGVLFRSRNLSDLDRSLFEAYLDEKGFQKRVTNEILYENNNSLPHLFDIRSDINLYHRKIATGIIIAELTASFSYIYLNALVGDEPEQELHFSGDPREMQRRVVQFENEAQNLWESYKSVQNLLSILTEHFDGHGDPQKYRVWAEDSLLRIENEKLQLAVCVNFSDSVSSFEAQGEVVFSDGYETGNLDAFGVVLWHNELERK